MLDPSLGPMYLVSQKSDMSAWIADAYRLVEMAYHDGFPDPPVIPEGRIYPVAATRHLQQVRRLLLTRSKSCEGRHKTRGQWTLARAIPKVREVMNVHPGLTQREIAKLLECSHGLVGKAQKELKKQSVERALGGSAETAIDPRDEMANQDLALLDAKYEAIRTSQGKPAEILKMFENLLVEYDTLAERFPSNPDCVVRSTEMRETIQEMKAERTETIQERNHGKRCQ